MLDPISVLSISWQLIDIINQVLERIEQPKEHARALKRLHLDAVDFLEIVNEKLVLLSDVTPFIRTIARLERLLQDILEACTDYTKKPWLIKVAQTNATKAHILVLDRRLRGFVDTYLIRAATETMLNMDALATKEPKAEPRILLPDDVRWDIMSSREGISETRSPPSFRGKVNDWRHAVEDTRGTPSVSGMSRRRSQVSGYRPPILPYIPRSPPSEEREISPPQNTPPSPSVGQGTGTLKRSLSVSTRFSDPPVDTHSSVSALPIFEEEEFNLSTAGTSVPQSSNVENDESITYSELVKVALDDLNAQPLFPLIFSISETLESMLNELNTLFWRHLLLDTSGIKHRILHLVTGLARELWLTRNHRALILDYFGPNANSHVSDITILSNSLFNMLEPTMHEDPELLQELLSSLLRDDVKTKDMAEALAVLEDDLRRSDRLGECVRWLARERRRDLMSFPERVKNLVLHSVQVVGPGDMVQCCGIFYRVAVHSKAIENYSTMRAIISALSSLRLLRMETAFNAPQLDKMTRFSCTASITKAKAAGKPYLCPLPDIFASYPVNFLDIVGGDQRIRWSTFKELYHKVDIHVSQRDFPLVSHQPYSFRRGQLVEVVKKALLNVELVDAKSQDEAAARRFREANRAGRLFPTTKR